jgi:hypothetical protein
LVGESAFGVPKEACTKPYIIVTRAIHNIGTVTYYEFTIVLGLVFVINIAHRTTYAVLHAGWLEWLAAASGCPGAVQERAGGLAAIVTLRQSISRHAVAFG